MRIPVARHLLVLLPLAVASLTACGPKPEFEDLQGMWGRVDNGEHQVWELARQIDATGLEDVLPAFRRWQYGLDSPPREVARGRWNPFGDEIVVTPGWSLIDTAEKSPSLVLVENQTIVLVGETGSGKTTQIPSLMLEAGVNRGRKLIACTQPRRARSSSLTHSVRSA